MNVASEIKRLKFIEDFKNILPLYDDKLPSHIISKSSIINYNSWFNIKKYNTNIVNNNLDYKNNIVKEVINCKKIKMLFTLEQKQIINKWMEAYTYMYNEGIKYIRHNCKESYNHINHNKVKILKKYVNFQNIRNNLKVIKNNILNNTQIKNINKNTCIPAHTLDYAIRQLTSNIKSAITNIKHNHIKRFRIKYWNHNRISKTIDFEKVTFSKKTNQLCSSILGEIKYEYNNKPFILPKITCNVKVNYNSILDEYTLLIPIKHILNTEKEKKSNNIIVLDPGLRTFRTGLSENNAYKIAPNINKHIRIKL